MSKPIILCVDDEQTVLESLEIELHKAFGNKYRLEFAENGEDALMVIEELLEDKSIEIAVVIADYLMPNIKGDELLERIHTRLPDTINIMLTGQADIEAVGYAINHAKLYRYITKPWDAHNLKQTVQDAVYIYQNEKLLAEQHAKLEQLNRLKDQFLTNISHELRTPLHGILGFSNHLYTELCSELADKHRDMFSSLIQCGYRLNNLLNNLLDFSRLKRKNIEPQLKPVNMQKMTRIVLDMLQKLLIQKDLTFINAISDKMPLVLADENRTQQILYNLIENAIKFTKRGQIKITAQIVRRNIEYEIKMPFDPGALEKIEQSNIEANTCYLAITISDTGIGIPADKIKRIFESFEQIDGSSTRKYDGTGLGLSLTKQLIELQEGGIFVNSTEKKGSEFTFILPLSIAEPLEIPISKKSEPISKKLTKFKILIIDAAPEILQSYLSSPEYVVTSVSSSIDALEILKTGLKPDVVVLNVTQTGYDVLLKIRETWSASALSILLLIEENQVSGLEIGANDYLIKPITKTELITRIKTLVTLKSLKTENAIMNMAFKFGRIGIIITDVHASIIKVNQAYLDIFGYTADELLGHNPSKMSAGQYKKSFYHAMWDDILTKGSWNGEIINRCKDGSLWEGYLSISTVTNDNNQITHYIGFLGNIV
ncbi:MAG: response regulator [Thiomargarita sp.]|nr:response regulator [Thiomargarita sp.]